MKWYLSMLSKYPILTKSCSSFTIMASGDSLAQLIESHQDKQRSLENERENHPEKTVFQPKAYDPLRSFRMGSVGFIFLSPFLHSYFRGLDVLFSPQGKTYQTICRYITRSAALTKTQEALSKLVIDSAVGGPVIIASVFVVSSLFEGCDAQEISRRLENNYPIALKSNYYFWPAANFLIFRFVPEPLRVLYSNIAALGWNIFLSTLINNGPLPSSQQERETIVELRESIDTLI